MPWRHVLRALIFPACCLAVNVIALTSARMPEDAWPPASQRTALALKIIAAACALAMAALPAGVAIMLWADRLARAGRIPVFNAFRFTYRVARALNAGVAIGLLLGCTTPLVLLGLVDPVFVPSAAVWVLMLLAAVLRLVRSTGLDPAASPPIIVRGRATELDDAPPLRALVEPIARKFGAPLPRHVVLGLEPAVFCVARDVVANEEVLSGGTLFVSLPMSRVMGRGELAALVAFGLWPEGVIGESRRRFVEQARSRTAHLLEAQPPALFFRAALGGAYLPIQFWVEMWAGLDPAVWQGAAQGGAIVAGRETMATALARQLLCRSAWMPFVSELHRAVRAPGFQPSEAENVSRQLARRLAGLVDEPDSLRPYESPESLHAAQPALAMLIAGLGVATADVATRLRAAPADPAVEMIERADDIERELSGQIIRALQPEWPSRREVASCKAADAGGAGVEAPCLRREKQSADPEPHPDERPMFTAVSTRRATEGVLLGVVIALSALWLTWTVARPFVYRAFPEWGATKTGPSVFPFTAHIGDAGISFTNGSERIWVCTAELGFPHVTRPYTAVFLLNPDETRLITYFVFRGSDPHTTDAMVRSAARDKGSLECVESSGRTHLSGW